VGQAGKIELFDDQVAPVDAVISLNQPAMSC
jgi:hypothetical protein